jgi:hypothetical protein
VKPELVVLLHSRRQRRKLKAEERGEILLFDLQTGTLIRAFPREFDCGSPRGENLNALNPFRNIQRVPAGRKILAVLSRAIGNLRISAGFLRRAGAGGLPSEFGRSIRPRESRKRIDRDERLLQLTGGAGLW